MAANALAPLAYHLQESLRTIDLRNWIQTFDLQNFLKTGDLKTFGFLALIVIGVIFLVDLLTKSYAPFGKSLAVSAADAWQRNRQQMRFDKFGRSNQSLEPVTEVLDAIAEAVKKWEASEREFSQNPSLHKELYLHRN